MDKDNHKDNHKDMDKHEDKDNRKDKDRDYVNGDHLQPYDRGNAGHLAPGVHGLHLGTDDELVDGGLQGLQ